MRMVDAQPVVLGQHLVHPRAHEPQRRTGLPHPGVWIRGPGWRVVLRRIQHRVVPRLALGVGAAGRRPHQIRAQQQPLVRPGIPGRETNLQIPKQLQAPRRRPLPQRRVLRVHEELPEGIGLHLPRVLRHQHLPAIGERGLLTGARAPQPPIPLARPLLPVGAAMLRAQHVVERVPLQPLVVLAPEGVEVLREPRDGAAGRRLEPLVPEGVPGILQRLVLGSEGVAVLHPRLPTRPGRDEGLQTLGPHQPAPGLLVRERRERHVQHVAREERPVIRRGVVLRRLPLRAELDAVEAQLPRELEEAHAPFRVRRAPAEVLARCAREARIMDAQHQVAHVQRGQGRRHVSPVVFGQVSSGHRHQSGAEAHPRR